MDNVSKRKRSEIMSSIRSKNTKLEIFFKKILRKEGIKFQSGSNIFGKPDIIIKTKNIAVFIDSCFWHGCAKHCRTPKSNIYYWKIKIRRNIIRDKEVASRLRKEGWKVLRVWEHDINNNSETCVRKLKNASRK